MQPRYLKVFQPLNENILLISMWLILFSLLALCASQLSPPLNNPPKALVQNTQKPL